MGVPVPLTPTPFPFPHPSKTCKSEHVVKSFLLFGILVLGRGMMFG